MKKHKKKYSTGGQLLGSLASLIPGYGQIISPLVMAADNLIDANKMPEQKYPPLKINTNIYGSQLALGGKINDGFRQYSTGSHSEGKDLSVDQFGIPNLNGEATVQNKENMFVVKGKPYVMSDVLTNPKTGNKFSVDATKVNKKYKGSRYITDEKNALNKEMTELAVMNDMARNKQESRQKAFGGPIDPLHMMQQESTAMRPFVFPMTRPTLAFPQVLPAAQPYMPSTRRPGYDPMSSGSSHSKSKDRFRERAYGGPIDPLTLGYQMDQNVSPMTTFDETLYGGDPLFSPTIPTYTEMPSGLATDNTNLGLGNPLTNLNSRNQDAGIVDRAASNIGGVASRSSAGSIANGVGLALKGAALGKSIYDAFQPSEQEQLVLPDYGRADKQIYSANVDNTQAKQNALGISNMAGNMNRSASGNFAQFQGRESGRYAQLQDQYGNLDMQQNLANSQLAIQRGQYEQGKAVDTAGRTDQRNVRQQQNDATQRGFGRSTFSDLSQIGTQLNQYGETQKQIQNQTELSNFQNNQVLSFLGAKHKNVAVDPQIIEKFKTGVLSVDEFLKYVPNDIAMQVKQQVLKTN